MFTKSTHTFRRFNVYLTLLLIGSICSSLRAIAQTDLPDSTSNQQGSTYLTDIKSLVCADTTTTNTKNLCEYGLEGVTNLQNQFLNNTSSNRTLRTCYCNEGQCPREFNNGQSDKPELPIQYLDVNLQFDDLFSVESAVPFAHTDCSGWISYLLQGVLEGEATTCVNTTDATSSTKGYCEVVESSFNTFGDYPKAFVYQKHFQHLQRNGASDNWHGHIDLKHLHPGDILAWCLGDFCADTPPSGPNGSDSGHIMLVIASEKIDPENHPNLLSNHIIQYIEDKPNVEYFKVAVIDSSSVPHASDHDFTIDGETLTVFDSRSEYGDIDDGREDSLATHCAGTSHTYGGLGSGVIFLAQWKSDDSENYHYSMHFGDGKLFPDTKRKPSDTNKKQVVQMAFGRARD